MAINDKKLKINENAIKEKRKKEIAARVDEDFEKAKKLRDEIESLNENTRVNKDANQNLRNSIVENNAQLKKDAEDAAKEKAKDLKAQNDAAAKQNEQAQKEKKLKNEQATKEQQELDRKIIDLTLFSLELNILFREFIIFVAVF